MGIRNLFEWLDQKKLIQNAPSVFVVKQESGAYFRLNSEPRLGANDEEVEQISATKLG